VTCSRQIKNPSGNESKRSRNTTEGGIPDTVKDLKRLSMPMLHAPISIPFFIVDVRNFTDNAAEEAARKCRQQTNWAERESHHVLFALKSQI
jgi:hypothetical protein